MKVKIKAPGLHICLLVSLSVSTASAQSTTGRFLLLQPSAMSNSMGGTGVALERTGFTAYSNVAGLAFEPDVSFASSFVKPLPFFENIIHSYITSSVRFDDIGTFGVSGNLYWKGRHVRTQINPPLPPEEDLLDWHVKLSYARSISEDFAVGLSVGMLRVNLADFGTAFEEGRGRATSAVVDAGVSYRNLLPSLTFTRNVDDTENPLNHLWDPLFHTGVSVGIALSNVGPKLTMIDAAQADPLPTTLTVGFAYSPVRTIPIGLMVAVDFENQLNDDSFLRYVHWGSEVQVFKILALRGGYSQDTSGPTISYWTWGFGLRFRFLNINIARYTRAILPSWHFDGTLSREVE